MISAEAKRSKAARREIMEPKDWPETSSDYAREVPVPRQILGRTARSLTCLKSDCRNDGRVTFSTHDGITDQSQ